MRNPFVSCTPAGLRLLGGLALAASLGFAGSAVAGESNCCFANGGLGCDDPECQAAVCGADAFCCDVAWDEICAGAANSLCAVCGVVAPANDLCGDAEAIFAGGTPFSTLGAGTDGPELPPECDKGFGTTFVSDVWFTHTVTETGTLCISTCAAATFDTRLAVYEGSCDNLILYACNDDGPGCPGFTSELQIPVFEGQELIIRVGGFGGAGDGTLTLTYGGCPAVELCPPSDHDCFTAGGPGCTDTECCNTVCAVDSFCCEVAWDGICVNEAFQLCAPPKCDWFCPEGATFEKEACGDDTNGGCNAPPAGNSNCCFANGGVGCDDPTCQDTVCAVDSFCCDTAWDGLCAAQAIDLCGDLCAAEAAFEPIACGQTICGTVWADGGTRDTDWYEIVFAEDTEVTFSASTTLPLVIGIVDTGGVPDCAVATALDPFATAGFCGEASFTVCLPAGTYWFFAAPNGFDGFPCGTTNDYWISLECTPCKFTGPACDLCTEPCEAVEGANLFSTIDANTDGPPLPPECDEGFGLSFVADVWFTYTPTETEVVTISTCNTATFDTRLAVYTGDCGSLDLIGCNDDGPGCAGFTSQLDVLLEADTKYLIRVGGFGGEGTGTLTIGKGGAGLTNDDCADAETITDGVTNFSTVGATTDGPALPPECDEGFGLGFVNDIWYEYTPTCGGTVTVSTCDSASYDTRLAVYTGGCDGLTLVACNDDGDGCAGFTSFLEFASTCGETYLIRVGGFAASGAGALTVACVGDPCDEECLGDLDGDGSVGGGDLGILLAQWGGPGSGDLDGSGTVDGGDLGILLSVWGACQ